MDSLFSHGDAGSAAAASRTPPPTLSAEVSVPRNPDDSFAGFTDGIHLWWPVEETRFGEGTHPEFTDGELFEEDASRKSALWATLLGSSSDGALELAWHHQGNPNISSHVTVSFTPDGAGTHVSVVHDGWAEGDLGYEQFAAAPHWPAVLASYRRFMGGPA
jgi:hypothetical protein